MQFQLTRLLVNGPAAQVVRHLPHYQQMPSGRINRKTSRLSFNRRVALNNKASCFGIDPEVRQSA
jgi:hypothetical protein